MVTGDPTTPSGGTAQQISEGHGEGPRGHLAQNLQMLSIGGERAGWDPRAAWTRLGPPRGPTFATAPGRGTRTRTRTHAHSALAQTRPSRRRRRAAPAPRPPGRPTGPAPHPKGRVPAAGQGGARRACALALRTAPASPGAGSTT